MTKMLYAAEITYKTPSGRLTVYSRVVAGNTLAEAEEALRERLEADHRYGRRKVAGMIGRFSASPIGPQIATN